MLGKVIAHAMPPAGGSSDDGGGDGGDGSFEAAVRRAEGALREYQLEGPRTNLTFQVLRKRNGVSFKTMQHKNGSTSRSRYRAR